MDIPREFDPSDFVRDWVKNATPEQRMALAKLLSVLKDHFLPGTSLLRIAPHQDPGEIPSSFNVPFDGSLLNYEVPLRAEEPIKLTVILDGFTLPPRDL